MKKPLFTGLCTALVTPFLGDEVNYPMLDLLIRRQVEAGVDAIVLCGTTGESPTLSDEEKCEIFRRGVAVADGACKIIAGTGSNDTRHALDLSRQAVSCGVDGLLLVTPYYNKTTQAGLVSYYKTIAEAVEKPILAYNVPSRTGVDISWETCRTLGDIPNLAGIKEANADITKSLRIVTECGTELPLYSGNDDQTVAVMAQGGLGVISVASNVAPRTMKAMVNAALHENYPLAGALQRHLLPLTDLMFFRVNPVPVKAALCALGYDVGPCRPPLDVLSEEDRERVEGFFEAWKDIS